MKFSEIAKQIYSGQILSRVEASEKSGDLVLADMPVLLPKAISGGLVVHDDLGKVKLKKPVEVERVTAVDDIVIKLSTPYDSVIIRDGDEGLVVPSFCAIVRGIDREKADVKFIAAYLNTEHTKSVLKSKVAGSTMPLIKLSVIKDLDIPIDIPEVPLERQEFIGEAYQLSIEKQVVLRGLLENEQKLIESIVLRTIKHSCQERNGGGLND